MWENQPTSLVSLCLDKQKVEQQKNKIYAITSCEVLHILLLIQLWVYHGVLYVFDQLFPSGLESEAVDRVLIKVSREHVLSLYWRQQWSNNQIYI